MFAALLGWAGTSYGQGGGTSTLSGVVVVLHGPFFQQHDLRIAKRTRLIGHTDFEFAFEVLNALNHPNFVPVGGIGNTLSKYEVTALTGQNTARTIQLVSRINL